MGTATLANFPMQDQLTEATEDGRASENKRYNCVAVWTAAACRYLTGVWHSGDRLKDAIYGEAYANKGTAERDYIGYVARLYAPKEVKIERVGVSSQDELIAAIRHHVNLSHPTTITMPSAWNTPPADVMHPGSSHVGGVYEIDDSDDGYMTVMNPWGGFKDRRRISIWKRLLCYRECWPFSLSGTGATTMLDLAQVSSFYHASGDGWARNDQPGLLIRGGLLDGYRNYPSIGQYFGFSEFGLPLKLEEVCHMTNGVADAWRIVCERGVLVLDATHAYDGVPGVPGAVYRGHITAADAPLYGAVDNSAQLAALAQQVEQLKQQLTSAKPAVDALAAIRLALK
jgi:hypothetical protein